ncbi:MAG TPA: VTC domain-containing protein [Actinomycetaceae bacterium]|nr:VTC domain-containing protein [Actinomycetaceae bacterium]
MTVLREAPAQASTFHAALWGLPAVLLAELDAVAACQLRRDRKYLLAAAELPHLIERLPEGTRVLQIGAERCFEYSSCYLDTPALDSYHAAGLKRRRRAKVRLRRYETTGGEFLEVKIAGPRRMTVKHRRPHNGAMPLSADALEFVDEVLGAARVDLQTRALRPALSTSYVRVTLCLPGEDGPYRTTIDTSLTCALPEGEESDFGGLAVVETKGGVRPTELDRLFWHLGHRPCRFSKFGVGLAALSPGLSPEKWFRALDHDVPAALGY